MHIKGIIFNIIYHVISVKHISVVFLIIGELVHIFIVYYCELRMLLASDVKEEAEGVLTLVSTQITFERSGSVVAHVYGVHCGAFERNPAKFTSVQLGYLVHSVERDQTRHIRGLLL